MKNLSSPLWNALVMRGLSINEASKKYGIPYDRIWSHCTGRRSISPEMAVEYETLIGIPRSELRPDLWPPAQAIDVACTVEKGHKTLSPGKKALPLEVEA